MSDKWLSGEAANNLFAMREVWGEIGNDGAPQDSIECRLTSQKSCLRKTLNMEGSDNVALVGQSDLFIRRSKNFYAFWLPVCHIKA